MQPHQIIVRNRQVVRCIPEGDCTKVEEIDTSLRLGSSEAPLSHDSEHTVSRAALEAWILATLPRALAYARSISRNHARHEDIVQDCYLRLIRKAESYDLLNTGTKLLFKAITHAWIDVDSRERRTVSLDGLLDSQSADRHSPVDSYVSDPCHHASFLELQDAVASGLDRLCMPQRAALELKSLGHSLEEIAQALGVTPNHAGVLVHRARKALTAELSPFLESEPDE